MAKYLFIPLVFLWAATVQAGVHYSGEQMNELPAQWRGYLLDQRMLRGIAVPATAKTPASPLRVEYEKKTAALEVKRDTLSADELADLGAIYLRLGEPGKALGLLRDAERRHSQHFRIAANLGAAWHMNGELEQAAVALQQAVRLAPPRQRAAEEAHLKLVQLRRKAPPGDVDDLFGVRWTGPNNSYEPGKLAEAEQKKLSPEAVAAAQQLGLWLPADGRLLWQLAELANAYGDVRSAAAMMDGCVTQFNMNHPDLRRHRQMLRAAADDLARAAVATGVHASKAHADRLPARSRRPLLTRLDQSVLPPVSDNGTNTLPWELLAETEIEIDAKYQPTFARYLQDLNGKMVTLNGFMQPLGEGGELASFVFLEYPIGCWYCEMPEVKSMILVEMPTGRLARFERDLSRVVGRLTLNTNDPENFLYIIKDARVGEVD